MQGYFSSKSILLLIYFFVIHFNNRYRYRRKRFGLQYSLITGFHDYEPKLNFEFRTRFSDFFSVSVKITLPNF